MRMGCVPSGFSYVFVRHTGCTEEGYPHVSQVMKARARHAGFFRNRFPNLEVEFIRI